MESRNASQLNKSALQSCFVQQTLKSWRFFLLFSAPPLIWGVFVVPLAWSGVFIALLSGIVWLGCWRLWLDERYFSFISEENNDLAGEVLTFIWQRTRLQRLTLVERQRGALRMYRRTMWFTAILWLFWLLMLLWHQR